MRSSSRFRRRRLLLGVPMTMIVCCGFSFAPLLSKNTRTRIPVERQQFSMEFFPLCCTQRTEDGCRHLIISNSYVSLSTGAASAR